MNADRACTQRESTFCFTSLVTANTASFVLVCIGSYSLITRTCSINTLFSEFEALLLAFLKQNFITEAYISLVIF